VLTHFDSVWSVPTPTSTSGRAAPLPPEQRRAAIIAAVLPLLVEHGANLTTRQMADVAGVSEGTIFNVFDDKEELLGAAIDAALDQEPFEVAISQIDPSIPFEQRLEAATELIRRRIVDIWKLLSQVGHHDHAQHRPLPTSPALVDLLAAESDRLRADAVDAARLLRALTLSLTHPLMTAEPRSAADIVDVFLHGVGA
jgi:AcrR family transcriptional regulator